MQGVKVRFSSTSEWNDREDTADNLPQVAKREVTRTVRRHPYSFISLLTALPALLVFSLFSTVLCPPPAQQHSWVSRQAHSLLGLSSGSSAVRDTLCAPAYAYHDTVLEPYMYPYLAQAQHRIESHPIYTESVIPAYTYTSDLATKTWNGPVRPVVARIQKGVWRIYLTFIQPHVPYVRAKWHAFTAPYIAKAHGAYLQHVDPHVNTAQKYGLAAAQGVRKGYNDVSTHPYTRQASVWGGKGYREGQRRGGQAYAFVRPRVIKAGQEAVRMWRETVRPALISGTKAALDRLDKGTAAARA